MAVIVVEEGVEEALQFVVRDFKRHHLQDEAAELEQSFQRKPALVAVQVRGAVHRHPLLLSFGTLDSE